MINKWLIRGLDEIKESLSKVDAFIDGLPSALEVRKLKELLLDVRRQVNKLANDENARTIYPKFTKGDEVRRRDGEGPPAMWVEGVYEERGTVRCNWMVKCEDGSRSVSDVFGPQALEFVDPDRRSLQELLEEADEMRQRDERARNRSKQ